MTENTAILLMHCPDRPGLVAGLTGIINEAGGNILHLDQWVNHEENIFFMRIEWDLAGFTVPREGIEEWFLTQFGRRYAVHHTLHFSDERPRMAIFVSKMPHCLYDMLARHAAGEWRVDIPLIVSNHPDLGHVAERFGIEFRCLPVTPENKAAQEESELALVSAELSAKSSGGDRAELTELAERQSHLLHLFESLGGWEKEAEAKKIAAHARGVKLIGATSHFVTADLDQGPIIEQDVVQITHKDTVERLVRKGQDLEKIVLARAVSKLLDHRVLAYGNRTVVFD